MTHKFINKKLKKKLALNFYFTRVVLINNLTIDKKAHNDNGIL